RVRRRRRNPTDVGAEDPLEAEADRRLPLRRQAVRRRRQTGVPAGDRGVRVEARRPRSALQEVPEEPEAGLNRAVPVVNPRSSSPFSSRRLFLSSFRRASRTPPKGRTTLTYPREPVSLLSWRGRSRSRTTRSP